MKEQESAKKNDVLLADDNFSFHCPTKTMAVTEDMQSPLNKQAEDMRTAAETETTAESPLPMAVCGQLQWVKRDFSAFSSMTPVNADGEKEPRSLWWPSVLFNDYDEFQDFFPEVFDAVIEEDKELEEVKKLIVTRMFNNMIERRSIMVGRLLGRSINEYVEIIEFDDGDEVSMESLDVKDYQATQFVSFTRLPQEIHHMQSRPEAFMVTSNGKTVIDDDLYMTYMLALDLAKTKRMGGPLVPNDTLETDFRDIGRAELERFYSTTTTTAPVNESAQTQEAVAEEQQAEEDDSDSDDSDSDEEEESKDQPADATGTEEVSKAQVEEAATETTAEESDSSKEMSVSEAETKDSNRSTAEQTNEVEVPAEESPITVSIDSPPRPRRGRTAKAEFIPPSPKRPTKRGRRSTKSEVKVQQAPKSPPKRKGRGIAARNEAAKKTDSTSAAVTTTANLKTPKASKKRKMVTPTPSRSTRTRRSPGSDDSPFNFKSKKQEEFYQFQPLIKKLQAIGWQYSRAKTRNWQYVLPGHPSEYKKGKHLEDFFYEENEVILYCMNNKFFERRHKLGLA